MAEFVDPFKGETTPNRKFTKEELIRALRQDIAAEQEATFLYDAHAEATDHPLAKKVLSDIADEERVHVGEFQRLLEILTDEEKHLQEGIDEVDKMASRKQRRAKLLKRLFKA